VEVGCSWPAECDACSEGFVVTDSAGTASVGIRWGRLDQNPDWESDRFSSPARREFDRLGSGLGLRGRGLRPCLQGAHPVPHASSRGGD
jgi:hypothetical protein